MKEIIKDEDGKIIKETIKSKEGKVTEIIKEEEKEKDEIINKVIEKHMISVQEDGIQTCSDFNEDQNNKKIIIRTKKKLIEVKNNLVPKRILRQRFKQWKDLKEEKI